MTLLARLRELIRTARLRAEEVETAKDRLNDALVEVEQELDGQLGDLSSWVNPGLLQQKDRDLLS